uniref:GC-rich sequence DNA-binding factor 1 n=2 Tax=Lygus hesperus TaxID=30085 RepID=A0A146LW58_LYGHE
MNNETRKPKASKPVKQSLLSFGEDLEGDDGEVFKVKKSAQSKKFRKQLDKERKKKKDKVTSPQDGSERPNETLLDQDIVIKLKNTFPILNGREAEKADVEGNESEDESVGNKPIHRFIKKADLVIERGKIPDAATIHAARKQRQHQREMGEVVPLPEEPENFENSKSRLVREDDNDVSDGEEERMNMAINLAHEDRMRRKAEFEAAQHLDYEESDKGEEEEWEAQQIRKGVTGAQIAAVQQETMYYQQYMGNAAMGSIPSALSAMPLENAMDMGPMESSPAVFPPLPSTATNEPQLVISKLKERLAEVRDVHRRHVLDRDAASDEVEDLKRENDKLRENTPWLAERFRFYQDLRGYVTDLVDCLDEKMLVIKLLEQRVESIYSQKVNECIARRRQDVMDQSQELAPQKGRDRDENEVRRIAEREGRRIRRQRVRELRGFSNHVEGMSSDEETTETEQINARAQRDIIDQDAQHVFEDVLEEFSTIDGVLRRFETWKKFDCDAYTEAYVSLCLPKLLGPLIRMQILLWNPFSQGAQELEKSQWYTSLVMFSQDEKESEDSLRRDPDVQLLPRIIEKVIIPKLTQLVTQCWDPLSSTQTVSLVGLVTKFIQDYPTVTHSSKFLNALLKSVVDKMKVAVENDVYIPIYPRQRMSEAKVNAFFLRQCSVATKLLSNLVRWQGIISDDLLSQIALDALLTRYLVMAMRSSPPLQAANLCQMVGSALPRVWLQVCVHPPQLTPFLNEAKSIAKQLDFDKPLERDALERLSSILKATT